jgi:glucose dehydrogenase
MLRRLAAAAATILVVGAGGALANEELLRLQRDPNQWVMPNGNYASQRYSELNQITRENVRNLRPSGASPPACCAAMKADRWWWAR